MVVINKYEVPNKQWKKWNDKQKQFFNYFYSTMLNSQSLFFHPDCKPMKTEYWITVCWNAAWLATDEVD